MHFNHHGRIYTSTIQVPYSTNQNQECIIHIITTQKTINNQVQLQYALLKQPNSRKVILYSDVCIRPALLKEKIEDMYTCFFGCRTISIWYFKIESAKNSWYSKIVAISSMSLFSCFSTLIIDSSSLFFISFLVCHIVWRYEERRHNFVTKTESKNWKRL